MRALVERATAKSNALARPPLWDASRVTRARTASWMSVVMCASGQDPLTRAIHTAPMITQQPLPTAGIACYAVVRGSPSLATVGALLAATSGPPSSTAPVVSELPYVQGFPDIRVLGTWGTTGRNENRCLCLRPQDHLQGGTPIVSGRTYSSAAHLSPWSQPPSLHLRDYRTAPVCTPSGVACAKQASVLARRRRGRDWFGTLRYVGKTAVGAERGAAGHGRTSTATTGRDITAV